MERLIGHGTETGGADLLGVFGEHPTGISGFVGFPFGETSGDVGGRDVEVEGALGGVDDNDIAIFDYGERATEGGFRGDVTDDEAVGAAAEASIGDEGDVFSEAFAHDCAGRGEHFAHSGTTDGAFVADDDDMAFFDPAIEDGGEGGLFVFEDDGFARKGEAFFATDFGDRSTGGEVSVEDHEVAVAFDGVIEGANDFLALGIGFYAFEIFGDGFASDRHALAVEETGVEESAEERADPADGDEFAHQEASAGFEIGEHGDAGADAGEVIEVESHPGGVGHGEKMEDGVGGAAEGDDHSDGVFEGLFGHDVEGTNAPFDEVENRDPSGASIGGFGGGGGVLGGAIGEGHPEGFDGAGHGVGGIHSSAGAGAGDGIFLDEGEFAIVEFAVGVFADGFEAADDVEIFIGEALASVAAEASFGEDPGDAPGENCATVDEDAGAVEARHGDDTGGHIFVATADGDEAIEAFAAHDRFDGIGDDLAGNEGILHAFGAHGDAIGNGDGSEDHPFGAGGIGPGFGLAGEAIDVHIARGDHRPGAGDADLGFFKVFASKADGVKHGAAGGTFGAIDDEFGVFAVEADGAVEIGFFRGCFDFSIHKTGSRLGERWGDWQAWSDWAFNLRELFGKAFGEG